MSIYNHIEARADEIWTLGLGSLSLELRFNHDMQPHVQALEDGGLSAHAGPQRASTNLTLNVMKHIVKKPSKLLRDLWGPTKKQHTPQKNITKHVFRFDPVFILFSSWFHPGFILSSWLHPGRKGPHSLSQFHPGFILVFILVSSLHPGFILVQPAPQNCSKILSLLSAVFPFHPGVHPGGRRH